MKRLIKNIICVISILYFCPSFIFSAAALQRTYSARDSEYETTVLLCQAAGVRYPTVTPVTAEELIRALERIPNSADSLVLEKRESLISKLRGGGALYQNNVLNLNIDIYGGVNGFLYDDIDAYEYFIPYRDMDPMIAGSIEASFGDIADLYLEFMEKDRMMALAEPMVHRTNFISIMSVDDGKFGFFKHLSQSYQPFKAGISMGKDWFNFQLARNRQSFGHGVTGNLLVSDNFSYEEYIRATFISDFFNYYLDITHFDQQTGPLDMAKFQLSGKHQLRAIHRFEFTVIDSLMFSVSLGSMFQSDSAFDWRVLIPMMVPHSFNNFSEDEILADGDEANNIFAIDLSWSFLPTWLLHFEAVMDQFQLSYEQGNFMPNAFGFLLNVQNTAVIAGGFLHSYIEAVYTMPYLYLNRAKMREDGRDYNYDWILGYGISGGSEVQYSGYPEGPDTFKLQLGSEYSFNYGLTVGGDVMFMAHGMHGIAFHENMIDTVNEGWRDEKNIIEYTLSLGLSISYDFGSGLEMGMDTALPYKWNYRNTEGAEAFIPQAFIFVRYSFF